jgi:hypothetical protein
LSGVRDLPLMNEQAHIDSEALIRGITRYLAAVDAFRTENCEPMWLPELVSIQAARTYPSSPDSSSVASGKHLH